MGIAQYKPVVAVDVSNSLFIAFGQPLKQCENSLKEKTKCSYEDIKWALVNPTTSRPNKTCQIKQVLDKSGQTVHNLAMGILSRVLVK